MIVRIADSSKRVSKNFKDGARSYSDAYAIIDCPKMDGMMTGIANGWKYDNRFDLSNFSGYERPTFYDISDKAHTAIYRDFNAESEGLLTFETVFNAESDEGCAYIAFSDGSKNALKLSVKNGRLLLAGKTEAATAWEVQTVGDRPVLCSVPVGFGQKDRLCRHQRPKDRDGYAFRRYGKPHYVRYREKGHSHVLC